MKATRTDVPPFRIHKATRQAYVLIDGARRYLGRHDRPEAREKYDRLVAEWLASGRQQPVDGKGVTVTEVVDRYVDHCERYYVKPDGTKTGEPHAVGQACKPLVALYGRTPAASFGPKRLQAVRQRMVDQMDWARTHVNDQVGRVKRMFKWAVSEELIPASTYHALATVTGLKRGRTTARETAPVRPVPDAHIDAVERFVSRQVWAVIQLQLLTAARPTELLTMRAVDLNMAGKVWRYTPQAHKNSHRGHAREIFIGPLAQAIVQPFLSGRAVDSYLFSAAEAVEDARKRHRAKRTTPDNCGNVPGSNRTRSPRVSPRTHYDRDTYRRAIARACKRADVPAWHPYRLRHNAGTRLRAEFGLEAAQLILGHKHAAVSELYAERDTTKAVEIITQVG